MTAADATGAPPRLLLVEDDTELVQMLRGLLDEEGYHVDTATDGHRGLHLALTRPYDVAVLDRRLPAVEGLDLLGRLRRHGVTMPVLVLSAQANPADRVTGLDAGAEDYLAKPFDVDELLARIRALLRRHLDRSDALPVGAGHWLRVHDRQVRERGSPEGGAPVAQLSSRECDLLVTLAGRPARVFSREELMDRVFPDAESTIAVDTYVHYLRRKLGRGVVRTVHGRGYQLGVPDGSR